MAWRLAVSFLLLIALSSLAVAQDAESQPVQPPENVMHDLLIKWVNPTYPPLARQARIQGTVILKILVSKSGDVQNLQLVSGHPILAPAAVEAVKQWKYRPYLVNGEPVDVETAVQVIFKLADKPAGRDTVGDNPGGVPAPVESTGGVVPQRVRVSQGVMHGLLVTKVNPGYPPDAQDQRIQGVVLLNATIDKEGNISRIELISGHPLLAPAAIDAVKQWKYRPYLLNGVPVEVETQIQVNFTLSER